MDHAVIWGGKATCIKECKFCFSVIQGNTGAVLPWHEAEFFSSQLLCICKDKEVYEYGFPASSWIIILFEIQNLWDAE